MLSTTKSILSGCCQPAGLKGSLTGLSATQPKAA